jgi:hypothetical protein
MSVEAQKGLAITPPRKEALNANSMKRVSQQLRVKLKREDVVTGPDENRGASQSYFETGRDTPSQKRECLAAELVETCLTIRNDR